MGWTAAHFIAASKGKKCLDLFREFAPEVFFITDNVYLTIMLVMFLGRKNYSTFRLFLWGYTFHKKGRLFFPKAIFIPRFGKELYHSFLIFIAGIFGARLLYRG